METIKDDEFMTMREFELLSSLVRREFGFVIKGDKRLTTHLKTYHRLDLLGIKSYGDYYNYIISQPSKEELYRFISCLTNNETYFMREKRQLKVFSDLLTQIKREKSKTGERRLRILSAGCSTGEEIYNLNFIIMESGLFTFDWDVKITGIDVDDRALSIAASASYTDNSFRMADVKEELMRKYFVREQGEYRIRPSYRRNVEFIRGNILEWKTFEGMGLMDVIFCRNVLIYMSDDAIGRIVANFHSVLRDNGSLFLGSSESLIQRTDLFVPEFRDEVIIYRKYLREAEKGRAAV